MSESTVARRYAEAFCELARDRGVLEEAVEALEALDEPLAPALETLFGNPELPVERRQAMLDRVLPDDDEPVSSLVRRFCKLLLDKGRFGLFSTVVRACRAEADRMMGRKRARVETPYTLDESRQQTLRDRLGGMFDAEVVLDQHINPELEAGLRVQIDDYLIDHDVQSQLNRLRERFRSSSA